LWGVRLHDWTRCVPVTGPNKLPPAGDVFRWIWALAGEVELLLLAAKEGFEEYKD